jgi:hypothetical protein
VWVEREKLVQLRWNTLTDNIHEGEGKGEQSTLADLWRHQALRRVRGHFFRRFTATFARFARNHIASVIGAKTDRARMDHAPELRTGLSHISGNICMQGKAAF